MMLVSLWMLLMIPNILSVEKVYKVELKDINKQRGVILVCLGTPQQCLPFKVSNDLSVSFVLSGSNYSDGFQWKKSNTFSIVEKNKLLQYKTQKLTGSYIKDNIQINTTPIILKDLELFMVDEGFAEKGIAGVLGLGVIEKIPNRTFLQLASAKKLIQNNGFHLSQKNSKGFIQFGLPLTTIDEIESPEKYETKPKICYFAYSQEKHLNCELSSVIYYYEKNIEPPVIMPGKIPFFFSNKIEEIFCPYYYFRLLTEIMLKPQIDRKDCKVVLKNSTEVILCNSTLSEDIKGEFLFVIGKWSIKYSIRELFVLEKEGMVFLMRNKDKKNNYWMLGKNLLDKYDFILNYEMNLAYFR